MSLWGATVEQAK